MGKDVIVACDFSSAEQVFSSIVSNLHKKGIHSVFRTDMVLYNAAIEQWLREGEKQ